MRAESDHWSGRLALRYPEAVKALGVGERTLRKWMREEGLPYFRVGGVVRFPVAELREWMAEHMASSRRTDEIAEEILREL